MILHSDKKMLLDDTKANIFYAIPAKWWKEWCDFVNVEFKPLGEHRSSKQSKISKQTVNSTSIAVSAVHSIVDFR